MQGVLSREFSYCIGDIFIICGIWRFLCVGYWIASLEISQLYLKILVRYASELWLMFSALSTTFQLARWWLGARSYDVSFFSIPEHIFYQSCSNRSIADLLFEIQLSSVVFLLFGVFCFCVGLLWWFLVVNGHQVFFYPS